MNWLNARLSRRFAVGTAAGLFASSLLFLLLFLALYRGEIADERAATAAQVNQLLQTSLENAMLKRDLEGLRTIVQRLGEQPGIQAVFITNPAGEIRFASDPQLLGRHQAVGPDRLSATTQFTTDERGNELLRSVNPVANRAACRECHGAASDHPVNGILFVDYDAAPIRHKARTTTLLLMGSGATIVLLNIAGGWWFINRYVIRPVDQLSSASQALAGGDLERRASPRGNDELAQLGHAFNDMADQLKERIDESEYQRGFLQALIDAIPDGVRVITNDYRVALTNRAYRQQMRLADGDDGVGDTCHRISHRSDAPCPATLITCPVQTISAHGKPIQALHRHHDADGNVSDVEIYAAPMTATLAGKPQTLIVESIRDLSKQITYSHEQKLSELGKLATGVAHEIHNPLTSVRLALHSLRRRVTDADSEVDEYLELVDTQVDKCVEATERLLRLGMTPSATPELVEVERVVDDTLSLLRWEADALAITLKTELERGLRVIATDSELRMVMLNLVQNAFHAMPRGGELKVTAHAAVPMICITIHDTGIGIEPDRLPRIFDPFYSRRADGVKGTGIGLSIVRTIVENYKGRVAVQSTPGKGTVLSVFLPDASTLNEVKA
ncbi:MAG: HAMP domain-containing protein [Gammaproteobacteria bacterium]|nr:HAMP domain-containing protein [Gammaproteobacteria bacterium]